MRGMITKFDIDARGLPIISDEGIWVSLADHQAAVAEAEKRGFSEAVAKAVLVAGAEVRRRQQQVNNADAQTSFEQIERWKAGQLVAQLIRGSLAALEPLPKLERMPTNWRPLHEYDPANPDCELVQVLCEVIADENNEIDHISSGDHAVGDQFVSIGFLADDAYIAGVPDWLVAGWCMNQDCFTDARCFKVVAWQPLAIIDLPRGGGE